MVALLLGPSRAVIERNILSYRRMWLIIASGFVEPVFYLFGLGVGVGALIGDVEFEGRLVEYATFVAPGLVASSVMNGAIFDSTFNFYYKLKYAKTFDAMLTTPLRLGDIVVGDSRINLRRSHGKQKSKSCHYWRSRSNRVRPLF